MGFAIQQSFYPKPLLGCSLYIVPYTSLFFIFNNYINIIEYQTNLKIFWKYYLQYLLQNVFVINK